MIDREKLIKAWEIFRDSNPYEICDGREFRAIKDPEYCMGQMIEDTITVLKKQEAVMGWKDARQETPDKQGDYLVFIPGEFHDTMMVARYSFNCEIPWRGAQAHSAIEDVLFWMPLPNAPKESW